MMSEKKNLTITYFDGHLENFELIKPCTITHNWLANTMEIKSDGKPALTILLQHAKCYSLDDPATISTVAAPKVFLADIVDGKPINVPEGFIPTSSPGIFCETMIARVLHNDRLAVTTAAQILVSKEQEF